MDESKYLETKHMELNDPHLLNQINIINQKLNEIYNSQVEMNTKFIKQRYYENGPRAKKLLAWRTRKQQAERSIHKMKDPHTGKMCHNLE